MRNKVAALTICQNEDAFLEMWMNYHLRHVDDRDIFILNDKGDPITKYPNVIEVDSSEGTELVQTVTKELLKLLEGRYDYVLYCDVDMLVVPNPTYWPGGLQDFLSDEFAIGSDKEFLQCSGYNIIDNGQPFNPLDPMSNREAWQRDYKHLSKVTIANQDPCWGGGFHESKWTPDYSQELLGRHEDQDVRLLNFGHASASLLKERWEARTTKTKDYRSRDAQAACNQLRQKLPIEQIPPHWRKWL